MATISDRPHRKARAVSEGKRSLTRPSFSRPPPNVALGPRQNLNLPFNYSRVTRYGVRLTQRGENLVEVIHLAGKSVLCERGHLHSRLGLETSWREVRVNSKLKRPPKHVSREQKFKDVESRQRGG